MHRLKLPKLPLPDRWRRLPLAQRGAIAITIPLLCLVTSFSAHLALRQRAMVMIRSVDRSEAVLLNSETLLLEMLNAETGVRGYYIGRQPQFLQPYNESLVTLPTTLGRIRQLLQGNTIQVERINTLEQLANQQFRILKVSIQAIARSTQTGTSINPLDFRLIEGKTVMDQFRTILAQLESQERQQLQIQQQNLQRQRDTITLVLLLGVCISSFGSAVAVGLFRDLALELRHREALLAESHSLIQAVFAKVVDGVVVLNAEEKIEGLNHAAEQMFGYSLPELIGQTWMQLLTPESHEGNDLGVLRGQRLDADRSWPAMGQRKDGSWFPIEASVSAIELDDRRIVIIRDVSERQQTAAKLQGRADELAELNAILRATNATLSARNRELDQLTYVVAHDLKAPLRAIANLSVWIEEDLSKHLPMESEKHMQLLRGRVHRMEALINGLLDYAWVGRTEIPIEPVDVTQLLTRVLQTISPPATFQVEIGAPMPLLRTRRLLLQQVFMNLIENAVDHHPTTRGRVTVSALDQGDCYEFAIADDGKGIDPRFYDKIYTIFQTLQARDTYESRGVGLAIVKKIVEMEGGTIELESAMGQGSTFRFTWPKHPLHPSQSPATVMSIDRSV
jgi:PAS domain S-box-containing protein